MIKKFRAWDGEKYWYADKNLLFIDGYEATELSAAPFELKDLEMAIGKADINRTLIYENDLLVSQQDLTKTYQVIWSDAECGFRKVPYGLPYPETKIDEAFMTVVGTIHSQKA